MKTALLFLLLISNFSFGQRSNGMDASRFKIGLKGGLNKTSYPDLIDQWFTKSQYDLQLIRRIKNSRGSFHTGLSFLSSAYDNRKSYHYIGAPLNYRIDFKYIYLSGGLLPSYSLNDYKDTPRKFQIGFNISVGYEVSASDRLNLFIEARSSNIPYRRIISIRSGDFVNNGLALGLNYKL